MFSADLRLVLQIGFTLPFTQSQNTIQYPTYLIHDANRRVPHLLAWNPCFRGRFGQRYYLYCCCIVFLWCSHSLLQFQLSFLYSAFCSTNWLSSFLAQSYWVGTHLSQTRTGRDKITFGSFVEPRITDVLFNNPSVINENGVRTTATIMFADLRGFTNLCEITPPEMVAEAWGGSKNGHWDQYGRSCGRYYRFCGVL